MRYVDVDDDDVVAAVVVAAVGDGVVLSRGDREVNAAHSLNSFGWLAKSHQRHSDHDAGSRWLPQSQRCNSEK